MSEPRTSGPAPVETSVPTRPAAEHERADAARVRATRRTHDVAVLLGRRPDLAGVHLPAEAVAATVTWCA